MKNSFTFRNNFLQNIIDLINFEALYSQFIGASTRERHRHLREQTFHVWFLRRIQWEGGGIDQILNFFFLPLSLHPFATRHDQTRSDPAVGNPVELRNYRATGHTLLSCLACFVLLAFARFTVNSDITH